MSKTKVYIDGQSGTTGLQIFDRIGARDDLELLRIDEEPFDQAMPFDRRTGRGQPERQIGQVLARRQGHDRNLRGGGGRGVPL